MAENLTRTDIENIIDKLKQSIRHEECLTCDCFQGLLVQLELDAKEDISDLTEPLKVDQDTMHGCLGCDPCPPGEVYADYMRRCSM